MGKVNIVHSEESLIAKYEANRADRQSLGKRSRRSEKYFAGGSCGCLINVGGVEYTIGVHPLKALARYLGYQAPVTDKSLNIFDSGYQNEWSWENNLGNGFNFGFKNKYRVADTDLFTEFDIHSHSLLGELKGIMSVNTAKKVRGEAEPKTENLIQAGLYSMLAGLPINLVYTQGSNFPKLPAGKIEFKLGFKDDQLYFVIPDGTVVPTLITGAGLIGYYEDLKYLADNKLIKGFNRGHYNYRGEPDMDWDKSDAMLLALEGIDTWDDYTRRIEHVANTPFIIVPVWGRGLKVVGYNITDLQDNVMREYDTLIDAQEEYFKL